MNEWQKRVVDERDEVEKRCGALLVFRNGETFDGICADEQERLSHQITVMSEYISILNERITAFDLTV